MINNHSSIISNHLPFLRAYKALFWSFFVSFCAFCAFLYLKNPRNLRNPWLINDLRVCKALYICRETFTDVMSALQINSFIQNEPNFRKSQMNVTKVITKDYEKRTLGGHGKNEPKTNPKRTQTNPTCRGVASGEAGTKPISEQKNAALHLFAVGCRSKVILALYPVIW